MGRPIARPAASRLPGADAPLPSTRARALLGDEILRGDATALAAAARRLDLAEDVAPLVAWLRKGGAPPEQLAPPVLPPIHEED